MHVLTIDDSPVFLAVFNELLEKFPGVSVVTSASNGVDGLAAAAERSPDIVFVDLKMPGLDGLQVTERLRQQNPATRVVLISLLEDEACRQGAVAAGAERFVSKGSLFLHLPAILEPHRRVRVE